MSINTTSQISSYIQEIFADALHIARDNNVMRSLVTVYTDQTGDNPRQNSEYNSVTINAIGEADDLASQAITPSVIATLTPAEYGAQYFLTDRRLDTDPFQLRNDAAMELGMGLAQDVESKLLSNFSGLTGGTVGAAGSAMSWGLLTAAITRLRAQNAPGPYYCVMHPYQYHLLGQAASVAGAQFQTGDLMDQVQSTWFIGRAMGTDFYLSSNIEIDGDGDATAAVFSRQAIALDVRRPPRIEPERDASRRGIELNLTSVYAHGVWRPKFGVQIVTDASAPDF